MTNLSITPTVPDPGDYLATLLQLGQLLNSTLDLKLVLETAIEQVIDFVRAERGFILLVQPETGRVWGEAVRNLEQTALEATLTGQDTENRAEISRTLVETVLETHQPILSHNAMEDPRFSSRNSVQLANLRSVLCVPLTAQGSLLGIIYLDSRMQSGVFTEHHLAMLSAFANQAGVAVENARLYDNLRRSLHEQLRLRDELHAQETQRRALEEASRMKSDFISYVAHELRNPLTTIRGYVQTMLQDTEGTLDESVKTEFHEAIEIDSDRLLELINELLDVSRLEAGRPLSLIVKPVALKPLLERLARRFRFYKHFTPQHALRIECAPDFPATMTADEDKLIQVFSNLFSNAIKYSPEGGTIAVAAHPDGEGAIRITVQDAGIGMTEEQVARLFQPYERLDREDIRNIPGTGLGLYLAQRLVELHGGQLTCESVQGEGTTFTVRLPLPPPI